MIETAYASRLAAAWTSVSSALSLDELLQRVVETAASLTDARYGALGVVGGGRNMLERFVTTGIDEQTHGEIGELPIGRGILGVLLSDPKPLRLSDLREHPRSVGFPAAHPPMNSFLGVPIVVRGAVFGSLYLTEKHGGREFTDEDEELVSLLASHAAVEIEKARVHAGRASWLEVADALIEVGNALGSELDTNEAIRLACSRLKELTASETVICAVREFEDIVRVATVEGAVSQALVGATFSGRDHPPLRRLLANGHSERVDSVLDDPELEHGTMRELGARSFVIAPLQFGRDVLGILYAQNKQTGDGRFSDSDLRTTELFATRLAIAIDLSQRAERSLVERALEAQETERRRIAGELHDETGQALTSILMGLSKIDTAETEQERAHETEAVRTLAQNALHEVRRLARDLRPKALDDFGLPAAVERLCEQIRERAGLGIELHIDLDERLQPALETALFRVIQESLTNVIKHAQATTISVIVRRQGATVTAIVEDDGTGFTPTNAGHDTFGLTGMRERLAHFGGTLEIDSEPRRGTLIRAQAPLTQTESHRGRAG